MKILRLVMFLILLSICGCRQTKVHTIQSSGTNIICGASCEFNQEHYIWENWIFPKNKTTEE